MANSAYWNIAIPVPLRRLFVYEVPRQLGVPEPGIRALVPFGRRRLTGYLLSETKEKPTGFQVKKVIELLDSSPIISTEILSFLTEAASYYMHPIGEVLRTALPSGIDPKEKSGELIGPRMKKKFVKFAISKSLDEQVLNQLSKRAPKRALILKAITDKSEISLSELRKQFKDATVQVNKLVDAGLICVEQREALADPFFKMPVQQSEPFELTDEQAKVLATLETQIQKQTYGGFLLQGVTGSGKTEVYMRAIQMVHDLGKGALVLVPEISLTPQLVTRYRERFGDSLAVWHSGLSDRERFEQWQLLKENKVKVAIGVRSAVFAPITNLGIIIVDEEHDGSFKQEKGFAYSARDLALLRAARNNGIAILGSATPSLESSYNANNGKLTRLVLQKRATAQPLPSIEIVDLRRHRNGPGAQNIISLPLHGAITDTLSKNEQVILFLNRRGFAPSLICAFCGEVHKCDDCAVSYTYHQRPVGLVCHYCGGKRPVPKRCSNCQSEGLEPIGYGTQQVEETVKKLFPTANVARLDRDVASGKAIEKILDKLRNKETDILVGTQMVTKGHDFPFVTLVGVLMGDIGLHMPDFRASERTFQLLTQVAGRAGRAKLAGRAIIQTYAPDHHAIERAQHHDFVAFSKMEFHIRQELGYPPFGRLAAIRISGLDLQKTEKATNGLFIAIKEAWYALNKPPIGLLGPVPAPIPFLQNRHRFRIMIRAQRQDQIRQLLSHVVALVEAPPSGIRIRIDIDPNSMM